MRFGVFGCEGRGSTVVREPERSALSPAHDLVSFWCLVQVHSTRIQSTNQEANKPPYSTLLGSSCSQCGRTASGASNSHRMRDFIHSAHRMRDRVRCAEERPGESTRASTVAPLMFGNPFSSNEQCPERYGTTRSRKGQVVGRSGRFASASPLVKLYRC